MIKANELRIGNWVAYDHEGGEHTSYHKVTVDLLRQAELYAKDGNDDEFERFGFPYYYIPLTMEILEKCGFERGFSQDTWFGRSCWNKGRFVVMHGYGSSDGKKTKYGEIEFEYLHQLQNLYFVVTGEELNITL